MAKDGKGDRYGERGRRIDARLVVAVVVAVLLAAFVFQNTGQTEVRWLFFTFTWPLWVVLALMAVVAFGVGWVVGRRRHADR